MKRPSKSVECPDLEDQGRALSPAKRPSERRPRVATYLGYDALGNQEMMMKATTDTALHRTTDEPPSRLQCCHSQHSSSTSHPAATRLEDHDDSHNQTCTRRWHSLQAKLARPFLRLSTLRSGEPPLCISPGPELYIRVARAPISGTIDILYHSIHSPL
jgi:hypothetical protein